MKYSGKPGFFISSLAAMMLLLAACGGDGDGNRKNDQTATVGAERTAKVIEAGRTAKPTTRVAKPDVKQPTASLASIEKASAKFQIGDYSDSAGNWVNYTITFDNYGNRIRVDGGSDIGGHIVRIQDHITKTNWMAASLNQYQWMSLPYEQILEYEYGDLRKEWLGLFSYHDEEVWKPFVTSRLPDRTIAGKLCEVYTIITPDDGVKQTIAIWNGILMLGDRGDSRVEAQTVTLDVPDAAFTRTTNITWIR